MFAWIFRWPRHAALCGGVVLVLLAYGAWSTWAIMTAQPRPTVDYIAKLNALTLEGQPEREDAWPVYRKIIFETFEYDPIEFEGNATYTRLRSLLGSHIFHGRWDDSRLDVAKSHLVAAYPLLTAFDQATALPGLAVPFDASYSSSTERLDEYGMTLAASAAPFRIGAPFRYLATVNAAAMRAAFEVEDWDEALARLESGLAQIEQQALQRFLVVHLSSSASIELLLTELCHQLDEKSMSPWVADAISDRLLVFQTRMAERMTNWIDGEALIREDSVQWIYGQSLPWNSLVLGDFIEVISVWAARPAEVAYLGDFGGLFLADREQSVASIESWREFLHRVYESPPSVWDSFGEPYHQQFGTVPVHMLEDWGLHRRVLNQFHTRQSRIAGVRVMALLESALANGNEPPKSLLEVISENDARDPVSGSFFEYQIIDDEADVREYVLRVPWLPQDDYHAIINSKRLTIDQMTF